MTNNFNDSTLSNLKQPKNRYEKLLNNLLDIKNRDSAIFTRVNNVDFFDVINKFNRHVAKKMILQNDFTVSLKEQDLQAILEDLRLIKSTNSHDAAKVINCFENYNEKLFNTKKLALENEANFDSTLDELIEKLENKLQQSHRRWSQFRRKAIDTNILNNVWPLHIATAFITVCTRKKIIYAPLFLKEVLINTESNDIVIKSNSDWKINEKIIFLLNNEGFGIDGNLDFFKENLQTCLDKVNKFFNSSIEIDFFLNRFLKIDSKTIKNQKIEFQPGIVLGMFKASGGDLRKTMMNIIKNDEVDDILDVEVDKRKYQENIDNAVKNQSQSLILIQPSNYSQNKALISALLQNTIIWGPPGTGKSQVIANIIANVLRNNRKAIVVSQKKAALDVLRDRLNGIAPFAFFILNNNRMKKADFYHNLKIFIKLIENNRDETEKSNRSFINQDEKEAISFINSLKKTNTYKDYLSALKIFSQYRPEIFENFYLLNSKFDYPLPKENDTFEKYLSKFARTNRIVKKGFWFLKKYPWNVQWHIRELFVFLKSQEFNFKKHFDLLTKTNYEIMQKLQNLPSSWSEKEEFISDEEHLKDYLSNAIFNKIIDWKINEKDKFKKYKRFANAVRASRRLPYKFVNDHLEIIQELFPVIITTPETKFIRWEKNWFDYAILDESSQIFLEIGLPIIYLAKIKVLAGDRQQMQPSRWFASRDDVDVDVIDEDVAENADSLLDYAFDKGVYEVMLNKNYRSSSAALMSFSSKHFYDSNLEVIDHVNKKEVVPIEVINVNGSWNKSVNEVEAFKMLEIANQYLSQFKKIILLTFNSPQRQFVEALILEKYPKLINAMEKEQIVIRNIENIQGDEADLVIASVVYDSTTQTSGTYVAKPGGKNALNVAISRARQKMIVIKSVHAENIRISKSVDFQVFRSWLRFLDLSNQEQKNYFHTNETYKLEESYGESESGFEADVLKVFKEKIKTKEPLKIVKQYSVGSKRIDLAFVDEKNKFILGIEVDGYKYHGGKGFDKYLEDAARQDFLEAKGYLIERIREINWKINQEDVLFKINSLLNQIISKTRS